MIKDCLKAMRGWVAQVTDAMESSADAMDDPTTDASETKISQQP